MMWDCGWGMLLVGGGVGVDVVGGVVVVWVRCECVIVCLCRGRGLGEGMGGEEGGVSKDMRM